MLRFALQQDDSGSMFSAMTLTSIAFSVFLLSVTPSWAAVDRETLARDRLHDVRELLDRRQAHRSMLTGKVDRYSSKLDRLQIERETAIEALADQVDNARSHERDLDRLMPRLLPRLGLLNKFRKNGAKTIAGLASMERNAALRERTRSRLLAAQTTSIEQMRRASTALRLLRRIPNVLITRHRDVDFRIPLLAASVSRLDLQQSKLQRRRDAAIRDLADLAVDIERLTAEEHRLARNMIARSLEATDSADINPDSLQALLLNRRGIGKVKVGGADVRGIALRQTQPTPVARPLDGLGARAGKAKIASTSPRDAGLSAGSKAEALFAGRAGREKSWAADIASPQAAPNGSSLIARVDPGRLDGMQTLVPKIEAINYRVSNEDSSEDRPVIEIAALPGQRVAAPDAGVVAFAGDFRSYGLLLIIEHGNGYHTLLWGFSSLDIGFGDAVWAGQTIGTVKGGPSPKLHVELRRNGQPVSPEVWLAASNSGVKG